MPAKWLPPAARAGTATVAVIRVAATTPVSRAASRRTADPAGRRAIELVVGRRRATSCRGAVVSGDGADIPLVSSLGRDARQPIDWLGSGVACHLALAGGSLSTNRSIGSEGFTGDRRPSTAALGAAPADRGRGGAAR